MRIRRATVSEARPLAMLRWSWRVDEEAGDPTEEREEFVARFVTFATDALTDRWVVWVAEEFGYVTNVYTVPAVRNRGVGSDLLEAVRQWAGWADLELLLVWPSDRSVPWYSRAGFIPSAEVLTLEIAGYEG